MTTGTTSRSSIPLSEIKAELSQDRTFRWWYRWWTLVDWLVWTPLAKWRAWRHR